MTAVLVLREGTKEGIRGEKHDGVIYGAASKFPLFRTALGFWRMKKKHPTSLKSAQQPTSPTLWNKHRHLAYVKIRFLILLLKLAWIPFRSWPEFPSKPFVPWSFAGAILRNATKHRRNTGRTVSFLSLFLSKKLRPSPVHSMAFVVP